MNSVRNHLISVGLTVFHFFYANHWNQPVRMPLNRHSLQYFRRPILFLSLCMSQNHAEYTIDHQFVSNSDHSRCMFLVQNDPKHGRLFRLHCQMFASKMNNDDLKIKEKWICLTYLIIWIFDFIFFYSLDSHSAIFLANQLMQISIFMENEIFCKQANEMSFVTPIYTIFFLSNSN